MDRLFLFPDALERDPRVDRWLQEQPGELGQIARHWFGVLRACGDDVRELMHDGHATACVQDAAFAYVGCFTAHVGLGFFRGAALPDPQGLLQGTGKLMRHVKLKPGAALPVAALEALIAAADRDIRQRL